MSRNCLSDKDKVRLGRLLEGMHTDELTVPELARQCTVLMGTKVTESNVRSVADAFGLPMYRRSKTALGLHEATAVLARELMVLHNRLFPHEAAPACLVEMSGPKSVTETHPRLFDN